MLGCRTSGCALFLECPASLPTARSVREIILAYPCVDVITTYRLANALRVLEEEALPGQPIATRRDY